MSKKGYKERWIKRSKWLFQALLLSGAVNIGLLASLIYLSTRHPQSAEVSHSGKESFSSKNTYLSSNGVDVISDYFGYSYEGLLRELGDKALVEDGYSKRDFALSCLVAFHYFDIDKALAGHELQKRDLEFIHKEGGERVKLQAFPGLDDQHYLAILSFSESESWPFTSQGLFFAMKRNLEARGELPESLVDAFYITSEFHAIWMAFNRVGQQLSMSEILSIALEAQWDDIQSFYRRVNATMDYSLDSCRDFLISLLEKKSEKAALFLIKNDKDFALSKLDDANVVYILNFLKPDDAESVEFLKQLLVSMRSDAVLKSAAKKLYAFSGDPLPDPYNHTAAVEKFLGKEYLQSSSSRAEDVTKKASIQDDSHERVHVVKKGETLWQIARDYNVKISAIRKKNGMSSSPLIKPGMKLKIP